MRRRSFLTGLFAAPVVAKLPRPELVPDVLVEPAPAARILWEGPLVPRTEPNVARLTDLTCTTTAVRFIISPPTDRE